MRLRPRHALDDHVIAPPRSSPARARSGVGDTSATSTRPTDGSRGLRIHAPPVVRGQRSAAPRASPAWRPRLSFRFAKLEMSDTDRAVMDEFAEARAALAVFTAVVPPNDARCGRRLRRARAAAGASPSRRSRSRCTAGTRPTDPIVPFAAQRGARTPQSRSTL